VLPDFHGQLWLQILRYLEMYMSADHGGFLAEAIPEALKNMLLVMLASGVFGTSNAPVLVNGSDVWGLTWQMLDRFCPTLQADDSFLSSLRAFGTSLSRARALSIALMHITHIQTHASETKGRSPTPAVAIQAPPTTPTMQAPASPAPQGQNPPRTATSGSSPSTSSPTLVAFLTGGSLQATSPSGTTII